jgi:hypothetical protein
MCTGQGLFLGVLGRLAHYRCRACGWTFEEPRLFSEGLAPKTHAIVGSRDYPDLEAVRRYVATLPEGCVVVSGGARGVDRVAAHEARQRGLRVVEYLADWDRFGRRAGFLRNEQIVAAADTVIAFWDGESRGTKHTIDLARRHHKPCHVILPGGS